MQTTSTRHTPGLYVAVAFCLTLTTGLCWALVPPEEGTGTKAGADLKAKEFFLPELYISSSHQHLDQVLAKLPNRVAWENFQAAREQAGKGRLHAFIDPRSGSATNLLDAEPLIPGKGIGNQVTLAELGRRFGYKVAQIGPPEVADAVLDFVGRHRQLLGVDMTQLGDVRAVQVNDALWHVNIPQTYHGIPVRHGRLAATISHGNLVLIGTETWGNVLGLSPEPRWSGEDAMALGFDYAEGQSPSDKIVLDPTLEVVPVAPEPGPYRDQIGQGYGHRLVWTFQFQRAPETATWEVLVDAHSGEVISFQDVNDYATITGGVYPVTSTEICPTPGTCGIMQTGWPMPWADTGLPAPNDYTNSGGVFNGSGTTTTTLSGLYVDITDYCGAISNSGSPSIDLGGVNGDHDCTSGGGSPGNTPASRTAFYEVNKLMELARGWLPTNPWLQQSLTTRVNLNNTCNAYYYNNTINFYRSGGGCRNSGELAGVFDHEWGHGLDYHDTNGVGSNPGEAYADIAEIFRIQHSCIGHGFWWTYNWGCGMTADGTGYNADEDQTAGYHCDLDCSGVRDADWDMHADHTPDTPLNFVCTACASGSGPCGRQVHCAAAPPRQAAWDFVVRDLQSAPFNLDSQTAFIIGNKVFYQGSGNIGAWYTCNCSGSSSGCGATNGYMQWLAADDDDGSISNGTPHMTALYDAYDRHEIACATPTPTNSGCAGGPTGAASLTASPSDNQVALAWTPVAGAVKYWVFRTEGHAGCDYSKALIAETTNLFYVDAEVANGREYYYNVVAVGTSDACFGPVSNCVTVTPNAATDVWSKDKPWDTGLEPDPATAGDHMWQSEDIWVRNDATQGPHQNPEAGQLNYVWINVRNRSNVPAYNMPIELWGTLASTGLSWPADWIQIGVANVPVVPANGVVQATVPWTPTVTGHYCLLVRHDTPQDPLTYPETTDPNYNTRYNNNIVWKNVNIVDLLPNPVQKVRLIVRNIAQTDLIHNLVFQEVAQDFAAEATAEATVEEVDEETDETFLARGKVTVELPDELAQRWNDEGSKGDGVVTVDANTVEITDSTRSAMEINLNKGEEFTITVVFEDTVDRGVISEEAKPMRYTFSVVQEEIRDGKTVAIGGVTYHIIAPPQ